MTLTIDAVIHKIQTIIIRKHLSCYYENYAIIKKIETIWNNYAFSEKNKKKWFKIKFQKTKLKKDSNSPSFLFFYPEDKRWKTQILIIVIIL